MGLAQNRAQCFGSELGAVHRHRYEQVFLFVLGMTAALPHQDKAAAFQSPRDLFRFEDNLFRHAPQSKSES